MRSAAKARMTEYQYERFLASQAIRVDDADVLAVLTAIDADLDEILAPG